jgi:hypothetical protein
MLQVRSKRYFFQILVIAVASQFLVGAAIAVSAAVILPLLGG